MTDHRKRVVALASCLAATLLCAAGSKADASIDKAFPGQERKWGVVLAPYANDLSPCRACGWRSPSRASKS